MMRISRTGYNSYEKLDKEYYHILEIRHSSKPTTFFDKNDIIKEIDPDYFDVDNYNIDECITKIQEFLRRSRNYSENGVDIDNTNNVGSKVKIKK